MDAAEVRRQLQGVAEEITDADGQVIGHVHASARFKLERPYLGGGGFLVVEWDEERSEYVASEWDALWDRKGRRFYPSGYCDPGVWRTPDLEEAVRLVMAHLG